MNMLHKMEAHTNYNRKREEKLSSLKAIKQNNELVPGQYIIGLDFFYKRSELYNQIEQHGFAIKTAKSAIHDYYQGRGRTSTFTKAKHITQRYIIVDEVDKNLFKVLYNDYILWMEPT